MPMITEIGNNLIPLLHKLKNPDFTLLMAKWMTILKEDNIRGVMAGVDGQDRPMLPVKYRTGQPSPVKKRNRFSKGIGLPLAHRPGVPSRNSPVLDLSNDNLTTAQYKKLKGPPLAPRGKGSRVIRNYVTRFGHDGKKWFAEGAWINVLSVKSRPFLLAHFEGKNRLPKRDLRGIRAWGKREAYKELLSDIRKKLRGQE
jgi:hypothetical protein